MNQGALMLWNIAFIRIQCSFKLISFKSLKCFNWIIFGLFKTALDTFYKLINFFYFKNFCMPSTASGKGALQPPWINWVIRLIWPHLLLKGSGSYRGCLTGETNDVVRSYGFALTEQASVTLLIPRRNHCSPKTPKRGMELSGIEPLSETLVWIT